MSMSCIQAGVDGLVRNRREREREREKEREGGGRERTRGSRNTERRNRH